MYSPKTTFKAVLSVLLAAGTAAQGGVTAFADHAIDDAADEFMKVTAVVGEASEYGEQYVYYVDENGEELDFNLIPDEMDREYNAADIPSSYNLNALGKVSSVKNQGGTGTCWAHAALAAAESSLIMDGAATKSIDLSESHLVWFSEGQNTDEDDPLYGDPFVVSNCYDYGGNNSIALGALSSWMGAANESSYPDVDSRPIIAESKRYDGAYRVRKSVTFDPSDRTAIKSYLMENGALTIAYHSDDSTTAVSHYKFGSDYASFYQNEYTKTNHAVTLVGWDDNFSKSNFVVTPPGNGAWLIKNSWGTGWGKDGYFYLSYYDTSIRSIASFEAEKAGGYSNVYQHSMIAGSGYRTSSYITGANVFTASGNDPLTAVSFYTSEASVPYTIYIYSGVDSKNPMSGTLMLTQSGTASYAGYHTVDLSNTVSIPSGTKFSVCLALKKNETLLWVDEHSKGAGDSFIVGGVGTPSSNWMDLYTYYGCNAAIKAFTKASAPAKPTVKAAAGDSKVTLAWNAVPGATKYAVYSYLNGNYSQQAVTNGTSYTVTGLRNGTKYGFLVRAYANGAWSAFTSADLVYATPVSTKPTVKAAAGDSKVTLAWNAVSGATKYAVYSYLNGNYSQQAVTTGTSYTVTGLTNGTRYGFLVRAYVNGAWSAFTSADLVYATPFSAKPTFRVTAGDSKAAVSWYSVSGATKYAVYSYLNGNYTQQAVTTGTSSVVTGLRNGTKYGFLVRAYVNGAWSAFTSADLVYATPFSAKPTFRVTAGDSKAAVSWYSVSGATKYAVYSYLNGNYTQQAVTTGTSSVVTGLRNGTKYGFLVRAYVNGAWSAFTSADLVYATPVSSRPAVKAAAGDSQVSLSWNSVSGASRYAVYSYLNGKYTMQATTTGTSYTVTGLSNRTRYGFIVRAYINGTWSSFTSDDLVYATPMSAKPEVRATAGRGKVTLTWTNPTRASKFAVYSYLNGKYTQQTITTGTSFVVTGLTGGVRYGFLVRSYDNGAWSAFTSDDVVYATPKS